MSKKDLTGERLKQLREKRGLTQTQLANLLGVAPTTISNYETNYSAPNFKILDKISQLLNISINYFSDNTDWKTILNQLETISTTIPYFKIKNKAGILNFDTQIKDDIFTLPFCNSVTNSIFCTDVTDNTMANAGIKKSGFIITDKSQIPESGEFVLIYSKKTDSFLIRRYISEGLMITYVADGYGADTTTIYSSHDDSNYIIIGKVINAIINL